MSSEAHAASQPTLSVNLILALWITFATDRSRLCYKFRMPRIVERWLLFKYIGKPLKKKEHAEKARLKYSERERKAIGIGVIRTKG
jgi:hypothetical protein